jgi:hypothetical protein
LTQLREKPEIDLLKSSYPSLTKNELIDHLPNHRTETQCQECKKLYYVTPWQLKRGSKYCSKACRHMGDRVGVRYCFVCGTHNTLLRDGKYPSSFKPFNIWTMTIYFCRNCRNTYLYNHRRRKTQSPVKAICFICGKSETLGKMFKQFYILKMIIYFCKKCNFSGSRNSFYGRQHSLDTKKLIGQKSKGRNVGRKMTAEQIRKLKQARSNQILPVKNTSIERAIQNQLTNEGIEFEPHRRFWIRDFSHAVDIFIKPNICVECDGERWHMILIPNNNNNCKMSPLQRDYLIDAELERKGFVVIRLSEHSIKYNLPWCMQLIRSNRQRKC